MDGHYVGFLIVLALLVMIGGIAFSALSQPNYDQQQITTVSRARPTFTSCLTGNDSACTAAYVDLRTFSNMQGDLLDAGDLTTAESAVVGLVGAGSSARPAMAAILQVDLNQVEGDVSLPHLAVVAGS
jgi:hypothetical protein